MKRYLRQAVALAALCGVAALGQSTDARSASTGLAGGEFTCAGMVATIVGTNGPDVLIGTPGPDVIVGLGGDDEIYGDRFDDFICGGPGDDYIEGGGGEDLIFGEEGNDVIDGGVAGVGGAFDDTGDDVISGGPGHDTIIGSDLPQAGSSLYGDQGNDTIYIPLGHQALNGHTFAFGGAGNDTILLATGDAVLEGGNGQDELIALDQASTAEMDGGRGVDTCTGGTTTTNCELSDSPVAAGDFDRRPDRGQDLDTYESLCQGGPRA
jgi:Ca2+-binding RTX toxin-like protein